MWQPWVATWLWHSCKSTQIARQICHKSVSFAQILISPNVKCTLTDTQKHTVPFWWGLGKCEMGNGKWETLNGNSENRKIGRGKWQWAWDCQTPAHQHTRKIGQSRTMSDRQIAKLKIWQQRIPVFGKNPLLRALSRRPFHNFPTFPSFRLCPATAKTVWQPAEVKPDSQSRIRFRSHPSDQPTIEHISLTF